MQYKGKTLEEMENFDVVILNFANCDMVGHTAVMDATVKAVEVVDECVGKAVEALKSVDGTMFICADHGNAEQMVDPVKGTPHTAHTANPVPFVVVSEKAYQAKDGSLQDVAPTVLKLLGIEKPADMTGNSLI